MSQLMPLDRTTRYQPGLPVRVSREIDRQSHGGLVSSAKVQAAAYVAHQSLMLAAMLSAEEGRLIEMCPLAEPRLKAIADSFAGVAVFELQRFAL